jgi:L,D-transpeptidase YcbB
MGRIRSRLVEIPSPLKGHRMNPYQLRSARQARPPAARLALLTAVLLAALSALGALGIAGCGQREIPPEVPALLRTTVETPTLPASWKESDRGHVWQELRRFYGKNGYQPVWSGVDGPLPRSAELLDALAVADAEGLPSRLYGRPELARELAALKQEKWDLATPEGQRRMVDLDVLLSTNFLTLADHLASGRVHPDKLRIDWYTKPRNVDLDAVLALAIDKDGGDGGSLRPALAGLIPPGPGYTRLRQEHARLLALANQGGWPRLPEGAELQTGATGPAVGLLRARLAASGDLPHGQVEESGAAGADGQAGGSFDAALEAAVKRFQTRHGLEATGKVDKATLAALNVPAAERANQAALNLERWRWMPTDLGERYLVVNVPEFELEVIEGGRETFRMRVIVGKDQSKTPVFSDRMTFLELNPYWNVPESILRDEIVPGLAKDSGYLAERNMEVVTADGTPAGGDWSGLGAPGSTLRVRQRPGPQNSLGRIKFMFPNEHDIYLHDTPADQLFNRAERDFSHGCIRVERPVDLAAFLLQSDPKWTREAILTALATQETKRVDLPKPLPVHIVYWTAWVEEDGILNFRDDVYGHDAALAEALEKQEPFLPDLPALRGERRAELARP